LPGGLVTVLFSVRTDKGRCKTSRPCLCHAMPCHDAAARAIVDLSDQTRCCRQREREGQELPPRPACPQLPDWTGTFRGWRNRFGCSGPPFPRAMPTTSRRFAAPRGGTADGIALPRQPRRPRSGCSRPSLAPRRYRCTPSPGQSHCEFSVLPHVALDLDRSAMLLRDDVVADRQAEPRPFAGWLGREKKGWNSLARTSG
jgi:hypothetical protein